MADSAAASCDVLVGSRGWEHQAWSGPFYPDDLPQDWRLTYYANAFRSVLVPAERLLRMAGDEPAQWLEDVPDGFIFFLEASQELMAEMNCGKFLSLAGTFEGCIGGVLLELGTESWPSPEELESWLSGLSARYPLGVDISAGHLPGELFRVLARYPAGGVWRPVEPSWSEHKGCIGFLDAPAGDLRRLREQVQAFAAWAGDCRQALLCFGDGPRVPEFMGEARVIAELLSR